MIGKYRINIVVSSISVACSLLLLANIILLPKLWKHFYQMMCALIAVADILQFLSVRFLFNFLF
jgi:hypothetical protein